MVLRVHNSWLLFLAAVAATRLSGTASLPRQLFGNASPAPLVNATVVYPLLYNGPPKLSESFLPAVMQALAYYVELIQYEPLYTTTIEPPFTLPSTGSTNSQPAYQTTTTRLSWTPTTTTTTPMPTTTRPWTTTSSWWNHEQTTPFHKPGYYAPEKPPRDTLIQHEAPKPSGNRPSNPHRPYRPAQIGALPLLSVSNHPYFDYYLYGPKTLKKKIGNQYFHHLPADLLQDIENESYELPAEYDIDNVNAFRKVYDDFFERIRFAALAGPQTGKKRIPPTRPYVLFLMCYDLLKREAKLLNLQEFSGYSPKMLAELHETAHGSAERQLYVLMYRLLEQNIIASADVRGRIQSIMEDLVNPYSVTAKAFRFLKPLSFEF